MRRLILGSIVFAAVLLAVAFAGHRLVDWNSKKDSVAAAVRAVTGHDIEIAGEVALSLLPRPVLTAEAVRLEGASGPSTPEGSAARLDGLELGVAFWPLLSGRVEIEEVVFVRPTLRLDLASTGPVRHGPEWIADRLDGGTFSIEDGTIVARDASAGVDLRIEGIHAIVETEADSGRLRMDGEARVHGETGKFEVSLARPESDGAVPLEASLSLGSANAASRFEGMLRRSAVPPAEHGYVLEGQVSGEGESLSDLISGLITSLTGAPLTDRRGDRASPVDGGPFAFQAGLRAGRDGIALSDLTLETGEKEIRGDLAASWKRDAAREARASLILSSLDLDRWLAGADPDDVLWELPEDLSLALDLRIERLSYRGRELADVDLVGGLSDRVLAVDKASAPLPGGGRVTLYGHLTDLPAGRRFEGYVTAIADDPARALAVLADQVPIAAVEPLGAFTFGGEIFADADALEFRKFDLALGETLAHGGLVVALKERPALGMGLLVDRLDLTSFLVPELSGPPSWEALRTLLGGMDANLDLRIGHLVHPALVLEDVGFVATLAGSDMTVESARARDAAGNSVTYRGEIIGLSSGADRVPAPVLKGRLEAQVAGPGELPRALGLDPSSLAAVLPLALGGEISTGPTGVTVKLDGDGLGGRFGLSGVIRSLGPQADFTLTATADHGNLAKLANRLADRPVVTGTLGRLSGKARLVGNGHGITVEEVEATVGPARVAGTLDLDLADGKPVIADSDLTIAVRHESFDRLLGALSVESAVGEGFGAVDLAGRIAGSARNLQVSDLSGRLGPLTLTGSVRARVRNGAVALGELDLALQAKHGDAAAFFSSLGLDVPGILLAGPVDVAGHAAGEPAALQLTGLTGRIGPVRFDGSVSASYAKARPAVTSAALDLSITHPDLAELAADLGQGGLVPDGFGGLDLRGALTGAAGRLELRELAGTVGPGTVRGRLDLDLTGDRPALDVDLATGPLPIAAVLASVQGPARAGDTGNTADRALEQAWLETPFDLAALQDIDATVRLTSAAWLYRDSEVLDTRLEADLRRGKLRLKRLSGSIYGGTVDLSGSLAVGDAGRPDVALDATLAATDLEIVRLLSTLTDFDRVRGPVSLEAKVSAKGRSPAELLARLTGRGTVAGRLTVKARPQGAASTALLALLDGQGGGQSGGQGGSQGGAADPSHLVLNAFSGQPARLSGTFGLTEGTLRTSNARIDGAGAQAVARLRADLSEGEMDSRIDLYRRDDLQDSYLTVELRGPMADPRLRVRSKRVDVLLGSGHGTLMDRIEQLRGMLGEVVDFEPMARYVLGPHTETVTPGQWSRFLVQYEKLFTSGYELPSGDSWTGDWKIESIRPVPADDKGDQLLTVAFETKGGGRTKVGFRIRENEDALFGFKIVDAITDGVSFLVTQRSEFSSILRTQGVDGLIRVLERRFSDGPPPPVLPEVQDWEARRFVPHQTK